MFFRKVLVIILILIIASLACQTVTGQLQSRTSPQKYTPASVATSSPANISKSPSPAYSPSPSPPSATPTTSVAPTTSATPTISSTPSPSPTRNISHVEVFEELWQTVNENYLYEDFNGLDWDAIYKEYLQEIEDGMSDDEFYIAMSEMIYRLGDEHSVYFSPEEAAQSDAEMAGEYDYVGIGILSSPVPERDRVTIILVFPESPAENAGLKIHDSILEVDGQPILDENGFRHNLLRGPEGTTIELTVQSPGENPRHVQIIRKQISGGLPVPYQIITSEEGKRIGYILVPTFKDTNVDEKVEDALLAMTSSTDLDGLIVDNRHNGGGASDVLINTLAYFSVGNLGTFFNRQSERDLTIIGNEINQSLSFPISHLLCNRTTKPQYNSPTQVHPICPL